MLHQISGTNTKSRHGRTDSLSLLVLALQPMDTPLTRLAEMADQVYECCGSPLIQQDSKSFEEEAPVVCVDFVLE